MVARSVVTVALVALVSFLVVASEPPKRSRATTYEKKTSERGKQYANHLEGARKEAEARLAPDPEAEAEARIARQIEEMNDPKLSPEDRAMHQREIDRDKAKIAENRRKKKYDPYADMKKRAAAGRMDHHVEIEVPQVDPEEPIVDLTVYNGTNLEGFFGETNSFVSILVVDGNCEHCADAFEIYNRVAKRFADEEFPIPHEHRQLRYAYLNATENRTRYEEVLRKLHFPRSEMHHLPSTLFVHMRAHWHYDSVPHFLTYRDGKYESDLTHAMRRIIDAPHNRFRNEDELMHCAFETSNDGIAFALFRDSDYLARTFPQLGKLLSKATGQSRHHIPLCQYTERIHEGEAHVQLGGEVFHSQYNPDNADIVAFIVNEDNDDEIIPEPYTISPEMIQSPDPPKSVRILETQRLRRWIESMLARRHNKSGRRFHGVKRRYQWQTHGNERCHDAAAKVGDVVKASIRATSVEHDLVFADLKLQKFIAGEAIPSLPYYLHNVLVGLCPGHHEIYSPPHEGFHAELIHINISDIVRPVPEAVAVEDPAEQQREASSLDAELANAEL